MQSSFTSANALSPESTVTSLLSSSGHLPSLLQPSALGSSVTYNHREYESASAALDAYIADFDRSRCGNAALGMGLVLPTSSFNRTSLSTLRNRDVLRERLSERELDFLSLPVSSLRHRSNRDRISMTTDELLNLPNDGTEPITHTSAYLHGLISKSRASQPIRTLRCSRCGDLHQDTLFISTMKTDPRSALSVPHPDWLYSRDQSSMHLPHWLSSNKAAVDCSDIHSLPDLPYPPWIQHCSAGQSEKGYEHGQSQHTNIEEFPASAPSWVNDLDDDQPEDSEVALRSLRLQLAEHISTLTAETSTVHSLYRDQKMDALIQKADRVLDSLQNSAKGSPQPPVSPDRTEELLLQDLEPSVSPTAQDRLLSPDATASSQPGPIEAVKQILFRLQAVERELQRRQNHQQGALHPRHTGHQGALQERLMRHQNHQQGVLQVVTEDVQWGSLQEKVKEQEELTDSAQSPDPDCGGPSLERAMHHLSRLKLLVERPHRLHRDQEDEGRFSSSSTEGL